MKLMRIRNSVLIAWLVVPMAGCASLYDAHYEHTQRSRTRAAWRSQSDSARQHRYPRDYALGWKDGFYDVTTGGKGCPPVVAPERYWKPAQILDDCDNRRNAYYDGFQDGVAYALQFPDTHHVKLWSSCECPLPTCEQCCSSLANCPTGSCGFSVYTDGEMIPAGVPASAIEVHSAIEETPIGSSVIDGAAVNDSAKVESAAGQPSLADAPAADGALEQPTAAEATTAVAAVAKADVPTPSSDVENQSAPEALSRVAEPLSDSAWEQLATTFQTPDTSQGSHAVAAFAEGMIDESIIVEAQPIRVFEPGNGSLIRLATEIELPADQ